MSLVFDVGYKTHEATSLSTQDSHGLNSFNITTSFRRLITSNSHTLPKTPKLTTTNMVCRKPDWHLTANCEDSDVLAARQVRRLTSDLFNTRGTIPAAQNEIMNRNVSSSPFLRLPPEIRLRIYKFVLGGQQLWIGHTLSKPEREPLIHHGRTYVHPRYLHRGGFFYHFDGVGGKLDLRLLRVSRQVFMETALLPYFSNKFIFESEKVRLAFETVVRPGKKLVQKKAVGEYEIMKWEEFEVRVLEVPVFEDDE